MSKIYKFKDFNKKSKVLESVQSYEGGCLMLKLKVYNWDEIKKTINFNDLYKPELDQYGISKCPHITILYPIDWDCDWELIHGYSSNVRIDDIKVCGLGLFENSDYDILKFNVNSKDLTNLHNRLREKLPNNYSFSEYNRLLKNVQSWTLFNFLLHSVMTF